MAHLNDVEFSHSTVREDSDDSKARPRGEFGPEPDWSEIVKRIQRGDPAGMQEVYIVLSKGVRAFLYRQLGPRDLDDKVHDIFLIVVQAIQRGDLREPERLMGYVRTVLRRQVAAHIQDAVRSRRTDTDLEWKLVLADRQPSAEHGVIEGEQNEIAARILKSINKRDREVLIRFYLNGQRPDVICREMGLTETQFRLIKSRAKARYADMCRSRLRLMPANRRVRIGFENKQALTA